MLEWALGTEIPSHVGHFLVACPRPLFFRWPLDIGPSVAPCRFTWVWFVAVIAREFILVADLNLSEMIVKEQEL
jgi:hypothetical protein